jgi:radical SAM superfamily enzyme YgiQ (UPF0313 family)
MVRYEGMVIRPPSEADSLILQITLGCSHDKCTFCGTYQGKTFSKRPKKEVFEDIDSVKPYADSITRIFLADGDAMVLSQNYLIEILDRINNAFPKLQRIGIYANARDVLKRTPEELEELNKRKIGIAYIGLESGSDEVLRRVKKGATAREQIDAVRKAQAAGIKMSVIALLGLGGRELSQEHAKKTAWALNEMQPRFASFLTIMLVPGTELAEQHSRGEFELLKPLEFLKELRMIIQDLELSKTIFRTNHASNFLALGGTFPKDKERILAELDRGIAGDAPLRPEFYRGL